MRSKTMLGIAFSLLLFAACKKNNSLSEPKIKADPLELVGDSASYMIDGKLSIVTEINSRGSMNLQPNSKVDSIKQNGYYISGDKDSVLFGQEYLIHDYDYDNSVNFVFLKKYHKDAMEYGAIFFPKNRTDLYGVGKYNYAIDFNRNNSQNGIALSVRNQNQSYQTFGSSSFRKPPVLKPNAQSESSFEIIDLKKLKSGGYILFAKFNATIYGKDFQPKKLENGYLRLRIY